MAEFILYPRFLAVVTLIAATFLLSSPASHAEDLISISKQHLDPEHQAKFEALHRDFGKAEQEQKEILESAKKADPLLGKAIEGVQDVSSNYERAKSALENAECEIEKASPQSMADYKQWRDQYGRLPNPVRLEEMASNPESRAKLAWSAQYWLTAVPREQQPEFARPFLPASTKDLTRDQALEILLKIFKSSAFDEQRREVAKLEAKLQHLKLPRKEVEDFEAVKGTRDGDTIYVQINTPDSVKKADAKVQQIGNEMSTVWPEWRDAYMRLLGAADSQNSVDSSASSLRYWLISLGVALVCLMAVVSRSCRSRWTS